MKNNKILKEIGLVLLVILIFLGGQFLVAFPIGFFAASNPKINVLDLVLTIPNIVLFIGFIIYDKNTKQGSILEEKGKKKDYLYGLGLGATYTGIGILFTQGLQTLLGNWYANSQSNKYIEQFQQILNSANTPLMILGVALIAPIVEELFFRGLLFNKSQKYISVKASAIVSALIFGLVHLNIIQSSNAFILGLLFAFIYYKTGNIYTTILAHLGNNLVAVIISYLINLKQLSIYGYILSIVLILLFIYLFIKFKKEYSNNIKEEY